MGIKRKHFWVHSFLDVGVAFAVSFMLFGGLAHAVTYNNGAYGSCSYQACEPSTIVTLPATPPATTPLQVNINLHDGQVIPYDGYTILVTPLNGQGTSFAQVTFSINGTLVQTQAPDEEGTVSWLWNPQQFPGNDITIVITGQDGESVTEAFNVTISSATSTTINSSAAKVPATAASGSVLQQVTAVPRAVIHLLERGIRNLPTPIKHSLPYFLFIILGVDIVLLFFQTRKEVMAGQKLTELLARERQSGELKKSFTLLISHYLRTPLTIITGALELANQQDTVVQTTNQKMALDVQRLTAEIEELVSTAGSAAGPGMVTASQQDQPKVMWRQPLFYVPVILVGVLAFWFDYLARHAGAFSVNQLDLIIQIVLFGSLAVLMYLIVRRLHLRKQVVAKVHQLLAQEQDFNLSREALIEKSVSGLNGLIISLTADIQQSAPTKTNQLLQKGIQQLQDLVQKLTIANNLKGVHSLQPYTATDLQTIFASALETVKDKAATKGIAINLLHNLPFQTQSPELLIIVLGTILDNAVAYSQSQGYVEVDASKTTTSVTVTVTDHGIGVPEDKRFALFQAFSKAEGAEVFNHEGMGFSLYLDKLIMNYLVGDITITSSPEQGTVVTLSLPLQL